LKYAADDDILMSIGTNVPIWGDIMDVRTEHLGDKLRQRRKSLGLTQDALADLADCSQRFVRALEAGKPGVRLDKFLDVADVLGFAIRLEPRTGKA